MTTYRDTAGNLKEAIGVQVVTGKTYTDSAGQLRDSLGVLEMGGGRASRIIQAAQGAKPVGTMASPPTVSVGASGANSTITGKTGLAPTAPSLLASSSKVTQYGGRWAETSANSYMRLDSLTTGGTNQGSQGSGFEFHTDAPEFDFSLRATGSTVKYRILVNEYDGLGWQLVTSAGAPATTNGDFPAPGTDNGWYYIKVAFGSSKLRGIRVLFSGGTIHFFGFNINSPTYTVWAASHRAPIIVGLGDSYTNGTGTDYITGQWIHRLGERLGCESVATGGSGTGYVKTTGSVLKTFGERCLTDVHTYNPDLVVLWGGINDFDQVAATIQANVTQTVKNLRGLMPNTPIAVVGTNNGLNQTMDSTRITAIKNGYLAAADALTTFLNDTTPNPYLVMGGKIGATTGTGNADIYTNTDGIHPPQAGHDYYAARMAPDIIAWLKTLI